MGGRFQSRCRFDSASSLRCIGKLMEHCENCCEIKEILRDLIEQLFTTLPKNQKPIKIESTFRQTFRAATHVPSFTFKPSLFKTKPLNILKEIHSEQNLYASLQSRIFQDKTIGAKIPKDILSHTNDFQK